MNLTVNHIINVCFEHVNNFDSKLKVYDRLFRTEGRLKFLESLSENVIIDITIAAS